MVSFEVFTSGKSTPLIGAYLPPSNLEHLPNLEESLTRSRYQDTIVLGDLNSNIGQAQNPISQQVADLLMGFSLVDLLHHFWQNWRFCHMKTWYQVIKVRLMRARFDYILGTDWRRFVILGIRDLINYPSDHAALRDRLLIYPTEAGHRCGSGGLLAQIVSVHRGRDRGQTDKKLTSTLVIQTFLSFELANIF